MIYEIGYYDLVEHRCTADKLQRTKGHSKICKIYGKNGTKQKTPFSLQKLTYSAGGESTLCKLKEVGR